MAMLCIWSKIQRKYKCSKREKNKTKQKKNKQKTKQKTKKQNKTKQTKQIELQEQKARTKKVEKILTAFFAMSENELAMCCPHERNRWLRRDYKTNSSFRLVSRAIKFVPFALWKIVSEIDTSLSIRL